MKNNSCGMFDERKSKNTSILIGLRSDRWWEIQRYEYTMSWSFQTIVSIQLQIRIVWTKSWRLQLLHLVGRYIISSLTYVFLWVFMVSELGVVTTRIYTQLSVLVLPLHSYVSTALNFCFKWFVKSDASRNVHWFYM